jgi:hypothetical protein
MDIAAELDRAGLTKEADIVDVIIRKVAQHQLEMGEGEFGGEPEFEDSSVPTEIVDADEFSELFGESTPEEQADRAPDVEDPSEEDIDQMFAEWRARQNR